VSQLVNNETRVKKPMYREPGGKAWKEVEWEWALDRIARLVKDSRDKSFKTVTKAKVKEIQPDGTVIEVEKEFTVNRTDAITHLGSAALDNEECYILQKLVRSWGLVYIEHQARI
jgi:formate dehydrogenase major subunit